MITEKLLEYGFELKNEKYQYCTDIMNREFTLLIVINADGNVNAVLTGKKQ